LHIEHDRLRQYYSGDLPQPEMVRCEQHLAQCHKCRGQLALLIRLLDEQVSAEEVRLLDTADNGLAPGVPLPQMSLYRSVWKTRALGACVALMMTGLTWRLFFYQPAAINDVAAITGRTLEARLAGQPYSEYFRTRTGSQAETEGAGGDFTALTGDHHVIGTFYLQHHAISRAVAQLQATAEAAPDSAEMHNDQGVAYLESAGDTTLVKATREFSRALELNPRYEPAQFNLALAYERSGSFPEAQQQLEKYLRLDPDSNWAKEARSKLQLLKRKGV